MNTKKTLLLSSILATMGLFSSSAQAEEQKDYQKIGDLEIFQESKPGKITIILMLDLSGSMGSIDCPMIHKVSSLSQSYELKGDGKTQTYNVKYTGDYYGRGFCDSGGGPAPTKRIEILKHAVMKLIEESDLPEGTKIGIGTLGDPKAGGQVRIAVPAKELTFEHRKRIMDFADSDIVAYGGTPLSAAYRESYNYLTGGNAIFYSAADTKQGSRYESPVRDLRSKCDANGIYMLTDGDSSDGINFVRDAKTAYDTYGIKSVGVAFGPSANGGPLQIMGDDQHGRGGFVATSDHTGIINSIKNFATALKSDIPSTPSGTISIPVDPLGANSILSYAYLPMMKPKLGANLATWEGNLKKYNTKDGTLYGKDNKRLYVKPDKDATQGNEEFPSSLNPQAKDLWEDTPITATTNSALIDVGGTRSHLLLPKDQPKKRVLYVESVDGAKKIMVPVSVSGKQPNLILEGFNKLDNRYTGKVKSYLLNHLGYKVEIKDYDDDTKLETELNDTKTVLEQNPYMGGVLHSAPVLATYNGEFDEDGKSISTELERKDHLLYGSMDGVLHMVEASQGEEVFGFIPRAMFDNLNQLEAIAGPRAIVDKDKGFVFGVDAPWSVNPTYKYEYNEQTKHSTLIAEKMHAYGGLRMGGVGFYGLDIKDPSAPQLLFSIDNGTAGFERLGQTWSKPLVAKIRAPKTATNKEGLREVLVFGGGYDMCYENPKFKLNDADNKDDNCKNKTEAKGNAVYMVDANTGSLLQKWTTANNTNMKHSIVSEIVGRDRNNDGVVDHLYFGDLGGQIFRIDLKELTGIEEPDGDNNMTRRLVRLFDANEGITGADHLPYRFYEKPAVSIHNDEQSGRFALINISSGDKSSPTHVYRSINDANRIYGIIDRDVATYKVSATNDNELITKDLTTSDIQFYDTKVVGAQDSNGDKTRQALIENLRTNKKQGWYYTMTRFETYENVKNLKAVGSSVVMGNVYYSNIYNPQYDYREDSACDAKVLGGTERQMFCLPWGICAKPKDGKLAAESKNGTLGFNKLGPGIQEMVSLSQTVTNNNGKETRYTTLIGPQTVAEIKQDQNKARSDWKDAMKNSDNHKDHDLTGGGQIFAVQSQSERYVLKVRSWYDLADMEKK